MKDDGQGWWYGWCYWVKVGGFMGIASWLFVIIPSCHDYTDGRVGVGTMYTAEIERQRTVKSLSETWFLWVGKECLVCIKWEQLGKCSPLPEVAAFLLDLEENLVYSRRSHRVLVSVFSSAWCCSHLPLKEKALAITSWWVCRTHN